MVGQPKKKDPPLSLVPIIAPTPFSSQFTLPIWYICSPMALYCRKRLELFGISTFFGLAVSAVVFQYYGNEISSNFDMPALHKYLILFLILAYLVPTLVFHLALYSLNALLVRSFGKVELNEQRHAILGKLLIASISKQVVDANPSDLVEEVAWISLKKYWRTK